MSRVAICIPSGDMLHADFAMSLAAMTYSCGPMKNGSEAMEAIPIALCNAKGSLVISNRNRLVAEAQKMEVTHLLFMDSDMVIPAGALRRLLAFDKDVVGATYIQREEPHRLLGKSTDGRVLDEAIAGMVISGSDLMEVGALPGGCLLVKMEVFKDMVKPYFRTPAHEASGDDPEWIEGEDYYFSRIARSLGFSIWLDWGLSFNIQHLGQKPNMIPTHREEVKNAILH